MYIYIYILTCIYTYKYTHTHTYVHITAQYLQSEDPVYKSYATVQECFKAIQQI